MSMRNWEPRHFCVRGRRRRCVSVISIL